MKTRRSFLRWFGFSCAACMIGGAPGNSTAATMGPLRQVGTLTLVIHGNSSEPQVTYFDEYWIDYDPEIITVSTPR